MIFKKKLLLLVAQVLLITLLLVVFAMGGRVVDVYNTVIYYPFQAFRGILLGWLSLSLGDVLYLLGGAVLVFTIIKWGKYVFTLKRSRQLLALSLLNILNVALFVYLFFLVGWGANYYKKPLAENWGLHKAEDTLHLAQYDSTLVEQLNALSPAYKDLTLNEINTLALRNYRMFTDSKLKRNGLYVKHSLFSYFLERSAIEGYYNPFTGEGQISSYLPAFMLPFVVSHEMAHQAGIAAEGDANLMAFAVTTLSPDSSFRYSAYLNVWLYVDRRLHRKDSVLANKWEACLNPVTKRHNAILDSLSDLNDNDFSHYGSKLYDNYLKMQQQKDGIKSYSSIMYTAWLLEKQRLKTKPALIHVP